MKNEESLASDNIVYLKSNSNQDSINFNFRSKLIGGLNEEDVRNYISDMEERFQQIELKAKELQSAKKMLQAELAVYKATTLEEKRSLQESLEKAHNDLAIYVDECNNKDLALQSLRENKSSENVQLQNEIKKMAEEFEQISESATGYKKENNNLKSKIAALEQEISSNSNRDSQINNIARELEQQLEFEKSHKEKLSLDLEKALNNLAVYVDECKKKDLALQALSENKDSEIVQLQNEIKKMAEEFEQLMESATGFEKENNDLKSKIAALEQEISSNNNLDTGINNIVQELEQQLEFEKSNNEKQSLDLEKAQNDLTLYLDECKKKDAALQALSENKDSEITQLQNEIKEMAEKQIELEELLSVSNLEFEKIMESATGFEKENNDMKAKINVLEKEISSNKNRDTGINNIVQELEQQLEFEKVRNEKQSLDLEMYNQKIRDLEEIITKNMKEIEVQRKISEKTEQELNLEKARASNYKVLGFKDEIVNIYQQLEHLTTEQVNINNELQRQLEVEQLRANKAENGLADMIKWASELKEKLFTEQNVFETQVRQLAEGHNQFQSEIRGRFLDIEEFCNR